MIHDFVNFKAACRAAGLRFRVMSDAEAARIVRAGGTVFTVPYISADEPAELWDGDPRVSVTARCVAVYIRFLDRFVAIEAL